MKNARRVRRFARESRRGLRVVDQRRIHDLDRALPIHLHVLGEIHAAHAAFAEPREHEIAVGDDAPDERIVAAPLDAAASRRADRTDRVVRYSLPHCGHTLATAIVSSPLGVGCCASSPEPRLLGGSEPSFGLADLRPNRHCLP